MPPSSHRAAFSAALYRPLAGRGHGVAAPARQLNLGLASTFASPGISALPHAAEFPQGRLEPARHGSLAGRGHGVAPPARVNKILAWHQLLPLDPKDFDFNSRGGDYLLYLGRIVSRKGLDIVVHLARDTGKNVVVAGQGKLENALTKGLAIPKNVECVGYADIEKRRELLAGAEALLAPTRYNEPFGGVAVEAMLSGTPVICSDHGAFPETVDQGLGGLRCANYAAFLRAAREGAAGLDRHTVRSRAERYLLESVAPLYHDYLSWLHALALDKRRRWWTPAESLAREP